MHDLGEAQPLVDGADGEAGEEDGRDAEPDPADRDAAERIAERDDGEEEEERVLGEQVDHDREDGRGGVMAGA